MPAAVILVPDTAHVVGFFSSDIPADEQVKFYLYEVPWKHMFMFHPDDEWRLAASHLLRDHDPANWLFNIETDSAGKHRISLYGPIPARSVTPAPLSEGMTDPPAGT